MFDLCSDPRPVRTHIQYINFESFVVRKDTRIFFLKKFNAVPTCNVPIVGEVSITVQDINYLVGI